MAVTKGFALITRGEVLRAKGCLYPFLHLIFTTVLGIYPMFIVIDEETAFQIRPVAPGLTFPANKEH